MVDTNMWYKTKCGAIIHGSEVSVVKDGKISWMRELNNTSFRDAKHIMYYESEIVDEEEDIVFLIKEGDIVFFELAVYGKTERRKFGYVVDRYAEFYELARETRIHSVLTLEQQNRHVQPVLIIKNKAEEQTK